MSFVPTAISRKVAETGLRASKNAPSLLFGAGITGFVATTVLACRATLKLDEVLQEAQSDLALAEKIHEDTPEQYSEQDKQEDKVRIVVKTGITVVKLYGPAIVVGGLSIACLSKSKNILQGRNEALTAAYIAVDQAFNQYRGRVIEKYGEDADKEFRFGSEKTEVWSESEGKMLEGVFVDPNNYSQYARFFDELNDYWERNPEYNLTFLRCQQNYINDRLQAKGHVFLNEVYDRLGIARTTAGQQVGWVLNGPNSDGYIDFGIFDANNPKAIDFVNGREGAILLDFNVDGPIYHLLDRMKESEL